MESYKHLFKKSLSSDHLHFAAHSHHLWPDVTEQAQLQCWQDAASMADEKWEKIFSEILPSVQEHIAGHLTLSDPSTITFAPNTHEFVLRLLSCLDGSCPEILTTDSEFHSFNRQVSRLEEGGLLKVTRIASEPFQTFPERFIRAMTAKHYDMVFVSHVFFNSAYAVPSLQAFVESVPDDDTLVIIDGYHGFMALPTDLSPIASRAFYLAGGYKYAMSGEGCCFMHCPPDYAHRPRNTGWYAAFGTLSVKQDKVAYATDGSRFMGATFDPSGLYRIKAVMDMFESEHITVPAIHNHVIVLQKSFLEQCNANLGKLITPIDTEEHGHFLTYETELAQEIHYRLREQGIITDIRGNRLRFGFGMYHDDGDIKQLIDRIEWSSS